MHHLPNAITVLRLLLILPVGACVLGGHWTAAFGLFLLAAVSDGIDGWLARRFDWTTRFGAIADPLADKLLVAVVYVTLAAEGVLPAWIAVLVLGRDLVIVGGALAYHFLVERLELAPTPLGKINTLANLLFVGVVLISRLDGGTMLESLPALIVAGTWGIAVLTLVSGADYVRRWAPRADRRARDGGGAP